MVAWANARSSEKLAAFSRWCVVPLGWLYWSRRCWPRTVSGCSGPKKTARLRFFHWGGPATRRSNCVESSDSRIQGCWKSLGLHRRGWPATKICWIWLPRSANSAHFPSERELAGKRKEKCMSENWTGKGWNPQGPIAGLIFRLSVEVMTGYRPHSCDSCPTIPRNWGLLIPERCRREKRRVPKASDEVSWIALLKGWTNHQLSPSRIAQWSKCHWNSWCLLALR